MRATTTKWVKIGPKNPHLPADCIVLCLSTKVLGDVSKPWLSSPTTFKTQQDADKYRDDNGTVQFIVIPKPLE